MLIAIFVALVFVYSLASGRLQSSVLTAPIVFTAAGVASLLLVPGLQDRFADHQVLLHVAELGLVLLLFTDASRTDLDVLRRLGSLPIRLLSTGMLLTILLGGVAAVLVFPGLTVWEACVLAAVLAPTDAGLGQVIVSSSLVPQRIRQTLNVEAGLNDGLSVPFMLFFTALAIGGAEADDAALLRFVVEQIGYGAVVGIAIGLGGGWLLGIAHRRQWVAHSWQRLGVVALPLLCLLVSDAVGASMFVAAFVAGFAVQVGFREVAQHSVDFTEEWGQLFNLAVFFLFGVVVARDWPEFDGAHALYAVLSLTVVRLLPVAVALAGARLSRATVLFMGWFGPRGLASIVLGLVYLEHEAHLPGEGTIRLAVSATVLLSIVAHGLSAAPGIGGYARRIAGLRADAPELRGD